MENSIDTILFSGKFCPPHLGHIATILRLLKKCRNVLVVMLDYPERKYPVCYCVDIMEEIFADLPVEIVVNNVHFGKITKEQLKEFNFEVYCSGNLPVLRHIEKLGVKVLYSDRAYLYEASKIPLPE